MKKILLGLAFLGLMTKLNAQQMVNKEFVSTVGRAEEEVTPDIIYIDVTLKEFYDNGNTKKKVAIDKLEKDLFDNTKDIFLEKNLVRYISSNTFMAGYQSGVSRYLLYWIFKNSNRQANIPFL